MRVLLPLAFLLAVLTTPAFSYPEFFKSRANTCNVHPGAVAAHGGEEPVPEATTFTVDGKAIVSSEEKLCPGRPYNISVLIPENQHGLLTSSLGSWNNAPSDECPTDIYTPRLETGTLGGELVIDCGTDSQNVTLKVSYAEGGKRYSTAEVTMQVDPTCEAASCTSGGDNPPSPPPKDPSNGADSLLRGIQPTVFFSGLVAVNLLMYAFT